MIEAIAISVAAVSLFVSLINIWMTLLRKGTLRITRPTLICFAFDQPDDTAKVFLRGLLYSTSHRGQVVENMYVDLTNNESTHTFSFWGYGDTSLVKGSGLFVGREGVAFNHHFLFPQNARNFKFVSGEYQISIHASLVNRKPSVLLYRTHLYLTEEESRALDIKNALFFEWDPKSEKYVTHISEKPPLRIL